MSLLDLLRSRAAQPSAAGDTDTVRRIVGELDKLDGARARYLAAFAYVLSRVAGADLDISDVETAEMVRLVERVGHLPEAQAIVVVEIAKSQNRMFGGTENFLVTREFREIASAEQRRELLECVFAVAAADQAITRRGRSTTLANRLRTRLPARGVRAGSAEVLRQTYGLSPAFELSERTEATEARDRWRKVLNSVSLLPRVDAVPPSAPVQEVCRLDLQNVRSIITL
jgi:uncharacterized tellurite resistance protein B-like protein